MLKAARPSLAAALARDGWAATTVSATMIAAHAAGIRVFGTGGIGGVHRAAGPGPSLDISSDIDELARTPMAVVCAGPKAILDVPNTLEVLETRGVPVVAVGQPELPGFYARSAGIAAPHSAADVAAAADLVATHLELGLGSGILVCVPVPADVALPEAVARDAVERANADAEAAGIHGPELTPWLLARIAAITDGASVRANTALIVNNARAARSIGSPRSLPARRAVGRLGSTHLTRRRLGEPMRIYEGSPRQDWEEVLRSVGAYLDDRGMRGVVFIETDNGFIIQGTSVASSTGSGESMGQASRETLTLHDDDVGKFMDEAIARRGHRRSTRLRPGITRRSSASSGGTWTSSTRGTSSSSSSTARTSPGSRSPARVALKQELIEFTRDDVADMIAKAPELRRGPTAAEPG